MSVVGPMDSVAKGGKAASVVQGGMADGGPAAAADGSWRVLASCAWAAAASAGGAAPIANGSFGKGASPTRRRSPIGTGARVTAYSSSAPVTDGVLRFCFCFFSWRSLVLWAKRPSEHRRIQGGMASKHGGTTGRSFFPLCAASARGRTRAATPRRPMRA